MHHARAVFLFVAAAVGSAGAQQPGVIAPAPATAARVVPQVPPNPLSTAASRILPGTKPNVFTTIQGNALNSTNGSLPNAMVRLRDARLGRIVDTQITDKSGLFAFRAVDPGSYIVEIISENQQIIAASQLLNVNAGEAISAVVKPFRIPPFAGVLGHSAPQAATVTSAAATSGVLTTVVAGEATCNQ